MIIRSIHFHNFSLILFSKKRLVWVQEWSFFFDLRKEKGAQNPYPESAFAVNLLRWIVSILGSLSKLVEISASVRVRQFSQKYLLSPLKCSTVANCDRAQAKLCVSRSFLGVGEKAFRSRTLGSSWTGTLMSRKLSKRLFASSQVIHLVWCRRHPWNKSSKLLWHWFVLLVNEFADGEFFTCLSPMHIFRGSSLFFFISVSVSWRSTNKLHRNSCASCWRLSSNNGFLALCVKERRIFKILTATF